MTQSATAQLICELRYNICRHDKDMKLPCEPIVYTCCVITSEPPVTTATGTTLAPQTSADVRIAMLAWLLAASAQHRALASPSWLPPSPRDALHSACTAA